MKSITGEDLLKYINNRMEHLSLNTSRCVKSQSAKDREKIRRMIMSRRKELKILADLIHNNAVEEKSKEYARRNYEIRKSKQ